MNEMTPRVGWLLLGSVGFGVLMAARTELHSIWARAAVAACAGAVLGLSILQIRRGKS